LTVPERKDSLVRALRAMAQHEQGNHGWAAFHESLAALASSSREADPVLAEVWHARPRISDPHLITLLGIALRTLASGNAERSEVFRSASPLAERVGALVVMFRENGAELTDLLTGHSNSFTGARRFLLPQVLIGAFAKAHRIPEVRLLDIGTSIGLLPRQLNNEEVFRRFAPDLRWKPVKPEYRRIPLGARLGVDAPPLPDLDWVRGCHGPSDYYEQRFEEVVWSLDRTSDVDGDVVIEALDVLDQRCLADFVRSHRVNVAVCSFVLYQYAEPVRQQIISTVVANLDRPGLLLSMEPSHELRRMGCVVRGYRSGSAEAVHLADVSDAHFIGEVTLRAGYFELAGMNGSTD
jgi:hypothetical protein